MSWREKTYDELPALSYRGRNLRQSLRLVTVAWMWGVVWATACSGDQMVAFAKMVGFGTFAFGLMGAIPFIATLGQLPAAIMVERTGVRKYLFFDAQIISRLLWIPIALVPFIFWPGREGSTVAVVVALALLMSTNLLAHVGTPPWLTWMGDLIPRRIRGRYFARRSQVATIIQIIVIIIISLVLVHINRLSPGGGKENAEDNKNLLIGICLIFGVGSLFGVMDILTFLRIREIAPPRADNQPPTFDFRVAKPARWTLASRISFFFRTAGSVADGVLIDPMRDRVFRHYVCYGAVITFSATIGGWFFWIYCRQSLGFNTLATNSLFMIIGPLAGTITAGWWGRLIDRFGRRPVLIVSTLGTAISTLPWFISSPQNPSPQFLVHWINAAGSFVGSLFAHGEYVLLDAYAASHLTAFLLVSTACLIGNSCWTGVNLANQAVILGFSDTGGRNKYVAASSLLINLGGAAGGIVGGFLAQKFEHLALPLGFMVLNNCHLVFAAGMLMRFPALALLWGMPDPGSRKVRDMLKVWSEGANNAVMSYLFYPLRIFGWASSKRHSIRAPKSVRGPRGEHELHQ